MNEEQAKEVALMTNAISKYGIRYLNEFINFCLQHNRSWYELVVNHRAIQYKIIMALEDHRIEPGSVNEAIL